MSAVANRTLVVVGAGNLGCRVAELWRQKYPDATIYLRTHTHVPERTDKWKKLGYHTVCDESADSTADPHDLPFKAPFLIYCVPPHGDCSRLY